MSILQVIASILVLCCCQQVFAIKDQFDGGICYEGGNVHQPGEEFICSDRCNLCTCVFGRVIRSPLLDCDAKKSCLKLGGHGSLAHGESYKRDSCTTCTCNNGQLSCLGTACSVPDCEAPVTRPGECCPVCERGQCLYRGRRLKNGESFQLDPCSACTCRNGVVTCRIRDCAAPDCSNPIVPPGECCPVCPNGPDFL